MMNGLARKLWKMDANIQDAQYPMVAKQNGNASVMICSTRTNGMTAP